MLLVSETLSFDGSLNFFWENLFDIFPEVPLFTSYLERPLKDYFVLSGSRGMRKIESPLLFKHAKNFPYLFPSLSRKCTFPQESAEEVFIVVTGEEYVIPNPSFRWEQKKILYILDWPNFIKRRKKKRSLFSSYLQQQREQTLDSCETIFVSSQALKDYLESEEPLLFKNRITGVLLPPLKQLGWNPTLSSLDMSLAPFLCVLEGSTEEEENHIRNIFKKNNWPVIFWKPSPSNIIGSLCDLPPFLGKVKAVIQMGVQSYPYLVLAALSIHRPFIVCDHPHFRSLLPAQGGRFIKGLMDLEEALSEKIFCERDATLSSLRFFDREIFKARLLSRFSSWRHEEFSQSMTPTEELSL